MPEKHAFLPGRHRKRRGIANEYVVYNKALVNAGHYKGESLTTGSINRQVWGSAKAFIGIDIGLR
jgi:hypothetical protein